MEKSGIDILNREIHVQVYEDGGQFELDPHYHLAAINIFCKALGIADANGFRKEFPQDYLDTIENMIMFYANISFPDYTNPCFSDAKLTTKKEMVKTTSHGANCSRRTRQSNTLLQKEKKVHCRIICLKVSESGFFVFRNSWGNGCYPNGSKGRSESFWHCQPDNGTFELWFNGKNLFPDSVRMYTPVKAK